MDENVSFTLSIMVNAQIIKKFLAEVFILYIMAFNQLNAEPDEVCCKHNG